jgi:hypothetical protein
MICSLDELREQHPELGVTLYAMEPGGPVTLEVITPDGEVFSWTAPTAAAAIARAFPPDMPEPEPAPTTDIFE